MRSIHLLELVGSWCYLSQTSSHLVAIVGGLRVMSMRQVPIGQAAGLVIGLRLQEMACLLSSHQIHVAATCDVMQSLFHSFSCPVGFICQADSAATAAMHLQHWCTQVNIYIHSKAILKDIQPSVCMPSRSCRERMQIWK